MGFLFVGLEKRFMRIKLSYHKTALLNQENPTLPGTIPAVHVLAPKCFQPSGQAKGFTELDRNS
jgi:hypothetical protein